ncbi:MAG TPA: MarR family winged helix-turn-helix transcriptional regulator [Dehalococcoidia bacterium]|jgi:DNA-binding MarR family transcriptional regulator
MSEPQSESLFWNLQRAYRLSRREYSERLSHFDLTARQAALLLAVRTHPGRGVRSAAEAIGADVPTCSALVTRLEERALIVRRSDRSDRRRTCLYLSPEAEEIVDAVEGAQRAADARLKSALGADAEQLRPLLARLCERLSAEEGGGNG